MELKQKLLKLIRKSELGCFATVTEDNKPWVRYVSFTISDDMTIRFCTFANSRKAKQIKKNPEVHMTCGVTNPKKWRDYFQIQGLATVTQKKSEKEAFWNEEIAQYFNGPNDPKYAVVIVKPYRIEYWNIEKMLEPEILNIME
ncbi:MAG: hypothetical protein A2X77_03010 [Gammaproteobacteria bacterium GWE2_42_36]|nr:MAG: hypothetical protein A2X77_03010 [Gammaproteobacteria bacterium GWE2_42_36]